MAAKMTIDGLASALGGGRTTSRRLVEECLSTIDAAAEPQRTTFLSVTREKALAAAEGIDRLRAAGAAPSPYAGIPISIKDLFDIAGEVSGAASRVLGDAAPATRDAPSVARLKAAGFIVMGRTNMTEFAFSGLGINPHFGTPAAPWDRAVARIPGGSSSGAAVSVAAGMAYMGLGSDTGGSCRIPAALNGIVGYKPTQRRVPTEGTVPLSSSLDSVGPLANSVRCCAIVDAVLSGEPLDRLDDYPLSGLRVGVPETLVLDGLEPAVAKAFEAALSRLSAAGARIVRLPVPEFAQVPVINAKGGLTAAESYAWHRPLIEAKADFYDPRVLMRIKRGAAQTAADYIDLLQARRALIAGFTKRLEAYDVLAMPTVPMIAPPIADLDDDEAYTRVNLLLLRNPTFINMVDGCAISLPCQAEGEAPVGLMLARANGGDRRLFEIALGVERLLG